MSRRWSSASAELWHALARVRYHHPRMRPGETEKMQSARSSTPATHWLTLLLACCAILLIGLALRLAGNLGITITFDEAWHITTSYRVVRGEFFEGLRENKWLYTVVLSWFNIRGPEGPWLARTVSTLFSMVSIASCIALGRMIAPHSGAMRWPAAGLLAGLFYAALPMGVFHERQALVDPQMVAFTSLSIVLALRFGRRGEAATALGLALVIAAAYLTKILAIAYLGLPLAATVLLGWRRPYFWRKVLLALLATALAYGLVTLMYWLGEQNNVFPHPQHSPRLSNTVLFTLNQPETWRQLGEDFAVFADFIPVYLGIPLMLLATIAIGFAARENRVREVLFLLVPALAFVLIPLLAKRPTGGNLFSPRYMLSNAVPIAALAAFSVEAIRGLIRPTRAAGWAAAVLATLVILPSLWFDAALIRDPVSAPLPRVDRQIQYGIFLDYAFDDLVDALLQASAESGGQPVYILGRGLELPLLKVYLGPDLERTIGAETVDAADVAVWLGEGAPVFWIGGEGIGRQSDIERVPIPGLTLTHVADYEALSATIELYRVSGATGDAANIVYAARVARPEQMEEDYAALAGTLLANPAAHPVIIFPGAHAPYLRGLGVASVRPLEVTTFPLTPIEAAAALDPLIPAESGAMVEAILVDEAHLDPERNVLLALNERLYRVSDEWYGLIHRLRYTTAPTQATENLLDARIEDVIHLDKVTLPAGALHAGDLLPVALAWRTDEPIGDAFKVFVHVMNTEGVLVAQADLEPLGGLRPMPTWAAGELILDRFTVRLPADLPAGEYAIRAGIYDPVTGIRLRVTQGGGPEGDYVPTGTLIIE
ncbi:MAG: hypothetical protein IT326_10605 [Anaerolineae bacterium]|nr:hypothetical protein [Anaerolineae bacterium]